MAEKTYLVRTTNIPHYTGVDAGSVSFADGKAVVTDRRMAEWFREHDGYSVAEATEESIADVAPEAYISRMKVDDLKAYAAEKGIDLGEASKRDEIIEKIKAAEA